MKNTSVKVLLSAVMVMLMAWAFSSCSKSSDATVTPTSYVALNAEIALATNLITSTHEGTGNGEFLKGSQAILQAVITQAQTVASNTTATQATVDAATAQLTAAVAVYNSSVITPVDAADLVGQWTFDELTATTVGTTVKDYSALGNNGTIQAGHAYWSTVPGLPVEGFVVTSNIPTQVADRYGVANKALHFEAGANVQIPYSTSLNPGTITVALWAKADTLSKYWANNYMVSMNRWNGYKFQIQDSPRAFFTGYFANAGDSSDIDEDMGATIGKLNDWYHFAVTVGNGHEIFYVNGIMIHDYTTTDKPDLAGTIVNLNLKESVKFSPVDLTIGQDLPTSKYTTDSASPFYVNYGGYFVGALDEVRIYKAALSAGQISSIYNQEKP